MHQFIFRAFEVEGFKVFVGRHRFVFNLRPGVYFMAGENMDAPDMDTNGVGKSTMWDIPLWVFFNKTGRSKRPGEIVTSWYSEDGFCLGRVEFERFGKAMSITRTRKPNSLKFKDRTGEREIKDDEVERIIGMSEETFRRTIVLGQFAKLFLDLGPTEQAAMFSDVLDLNVWMGAADRAKNAFEAFEQALTDIKAELDDNAGRLSELDRQLKREQDRSASFQTDKAANVRSYKSKVTAAEAALATSNQSAPLRPAAAKTGSAGTGDRRLALTRQRAALRDSIQKQTVDLSRDKELKALISQSQTEVDEYRTALKKDKRCPSCGLRVSEDHLHGKLSDALKIIKELETEQKELWRETDARAESIQDLEGEIEDEAAAIEADERSASAANDAYLKWQRENDRFISDLKQAKNRLADEENQANPYESSITGIKRRQTTLEKEKKELLDDQLDVQSKAALAKEWIIGFKEIRLALIDEALQELEMLSNRYGEALGLKDWQIKFMTERELKSGDLTYGFSVLLYHPNKKEAVPWEAYCGGEVQRWQLAVSFALSECLLARAGVTPNLEVLDEPTQHMSPGGVEDLLNFLYDRSRELQKIIFFVDHSSMDRGDFDGVWTIQMERGGHSRLIR